MEVDHVDKLLNQSYWDNYYIENVFVLEKDNQVTAWLGNLFRDRNITGSCFEIGCFPGSYLVFFGKMGMELNGIDLTPQINNLSNQLARHNLKIGEFYNEDFFSWKPKRKYDVVCSFGFVEHFKNYQDVLKKQLSLVKDGGYLIVEMPNFHGLLQRSLHYFLDRANYKRHNIQAMNLERWQSMLGDEFDVIFSGCFGGFDFWVDKEERGRLAQYIIDKITEKLPYLKKKITRNSYCYSPYCGLVARKR